MAGSGKAAIAGVVAVIVVAILIAVVVIVVNKNKEEEKIKRNNKAANNLCSHTDYKETCLESLSKSDSDDPKELVKASLDYTVERINNVIKESEAYKEASSEKSSKDALDVCTEVLSTAVEDLKRAFDTVGEEDGSSTEILEDLKAWISAVGTYQQTCIDAFDKASSQAGEKMKELLKTSQQLASNGLAMLDEITKLIKSLDLSALQKGRRLLGEEDESKGSDSNKRSLYDYSSAPPGQSSVNTVVAQDGTGQYKTINEAIQVVPASNNNTYVIFVKAGVYAENVIIPKYMNKLFLLGDGPTKTRITGAKSMADGVKAYNTATVAINGDDFVAKDIGIENTAGPAKQQAVGLRVSGDRAVFFNVNVDGFEGSLFTHTYRQFYVGCTISGTLDFVFGDALAVFQNCNFVFRKPADSVAPCALAAQGRTDARSLGAIVIEGGRINGAPEFMSTQPPPKAFLGRPWKELSRTIIMQATIDALISPEGWAAMPGNVGQDTCFLAEFQNKGPGADVAKRVPWKGIQKIDQAGAEAWAPAKAFVNTEWIANAGVKYEPGMLKA